jgi:hypothetical protein
MLETLDPVKPVIDRLVGRGTSMKSSIRCEMHAEHRLSMPMSSESVSKGPERGFVGTASCVDSATKARACSCLLSVRSDLIHDFMISNHWSMASPGVVLASSPRSGCPEPWVASGPYHHSSSLSSWMELMACWTDRRGCCWPCLDFCLLVSFPESLLTFVPWQSSGLCLV